MTRPASLLLVFVLLVAFPVLAAAAAAPTVTVTSPEPGVTIASDSVDVSAQYAAPEGGAVVRVDLIIDGSVVTSVPIDPPEASGLISLTWEASSYLDGKHQVVVKAVDTHGKAAKTTLSVMLRRDLPSTGPQIKITAPARNQSVSGIAAITADVDQVEAVKYVVFLVDNVFKAMSNLRPYTFRWDTTAYLNGLHRLQARAYLSDGNEAMSRTVEVSVDNASGATTLRPPSPAVPAAVTSEPVTAPARATTATLPPARHTEGATPPAKTVEIARAELASPPPSGTGELVTPPTTMLAERSQAPAPARIATVTDTPVSPYTSPYETVPSVSTPPTPVATPARARAQSTVASAKPAPAPIKVAMLPTKPVAVTPAAKLTAAPVVSTVTYTVQSGDSLWTIAARHGVTPTQLAQANGLVEPYGVRIGQQLKVPTATIYVEGRPLISDVPTTVVDGRALTPFRALVEQAGGTVVWQSKTRQAQATAKGRAIVVTIGKDTATLNNRPVQMSAAAKIQANRTVVPVRFLGEALDLVLDYQNGVLTLARAK